MDSRRGKALDEMRPLMRAGGAQMMPASSADGKLLSYRQSDPSGGSMRIRDLITGKDALLLRVTGRPRPSPDGSQVGYSVFGERAIYIVPGTGGDATRLLNDGGVSTAIYGWSPDGKKIVYWSGQPVRFSLLDIASRQTTVLLSHPKMDIHGAELSPDQKWVAFHTPLARDEPIWIAPVEDGRAADESHWIKVIENSGRNARPWWSPNGDLLYYMSTIDGFRCIWAQPLHPSTKQRRGDPFPVYHLHGARIRSPEGLAAFGPAILPDGLIFGLYEENANVWVSASQ